MVTFNWVETCRKAIIIRTNYSVMFTWTPDLQLDKQLVACWYDNIRAVSTAKPSNFPSICISTIINLNLIIPAIWVRFKLKWKLVALNSVALLCTYSWVSNKRVYTRTCILAKFPLYTALLDTYTTPCKSKTWWANFFDKLKKLNLLDTNVAQDIEQDQNEHKTYENHNSYAHWTLMFKGSYVGNV